MDKTKDVAAEEKDHVARRKISEWWDSLTTKAKKATIRKRERQTAKLLLKEKPSAHFPAGYQCPKCWAWFRTPSERKDHRTSHHQAVAP